MLRELRPGSIIAAAQAAGARTGLVHYHPAFDAPG